MDAIRDAIIGFATLTLGMFGGQIGDRVTQANQPEVEKSMHEASHYPALDGKKVQAVPYLTLPFRRADGEKGFLRSTSYDITEGWIYSSSELRIHGGNFVHGGIDFHLPYGTPVVAPVDGYAMSSYHTIRLKDIDEKSDKLFEGKPVNMGLGYFVLIYVPAVNRFVEVAHVADVDPSIPFSTPEKTDDGWDPTNHDTKVEEWTKSPHVVFVKKGTPLGIVGYSGLNWGYDDYKEGATRPVVIDNTKYKSWDEAHIHFEEFARDKKENNKQAHRDPYAIYGTYDRYPTKSRRLALGKDPLFFLSTDGLPKYADDP